MAKAWEQRTRTTLPPDDDMPRDHRTGLLEPPSDE
jgi:hypothetical protein